MGREGIRLMDVLTTSASSIRECLTAIEKHQLSSVFVVDDARRLLGVVSESDIRKASAGGVSPDDDARELVRQPPVTVPPTCGRAEAIDLMRMLRMTELPVVESDGTVVGVHIDQRVVGIEKYENWAVVTAGGRGSWLSPLTGNISNPMLPVAGRLDLERLVLHLAGSGFGRVFLSVNYLRSNIECHFGDGSDFGCTIDYLWEDPDRPLGTGGSLALLRSRDMRPTAPLLVMNGDLVADFEVGEMLAAHARTGVFATIATAQSEHQVPFGVWETDSDRLERIVEKATTSWPVDTGIYVLEPQLLERIQPDTFFPITHLFDGCLARGEPVGLWPLRGHGQDVRRPRELATAWSQR